MGSDDRLMSPFSSSMHGGCEPFGGAQGTATPAHSPNLLARRPRQPWLAPSFWPMATLTTWFPMQLERRPAMCC